MEEILNNLYVGEILYITRNEVHYLFKGRSADDGIKYSINNSSKTIPLNTINAALLSINNGDVINRRWYYEFNAHECKTRGCNIKVLTGLLQRIDY